MLTDITPERIDYSLRRQYVDEFHFRHVAAIPCGSQVLDLGGAKILKRGRFDIDAYGLNVTCVNLSPAKQPDIIADAAALPLADASFDVVICSELLEHVRQPTDVIAEAHRVLRPGGLLLICVPFLFRIHGDPEDYGRYTDHYWKTVLASAGFTQVTVEAQGLFGSVLVDMIREYLYQRLKTGWPRTALLRKLHVWCLARLRKKALAWDRRVLERGDQFLASYTTGWGIRALKETRKSEEHS